MRLYAGLVAWQPGELEQEMQRGYWFAMAEDAGIVFSKDTEGLGAELASRLLAMTS